MGDRGLDGQAAALRHVVIGAGSSVYKMHSAALASERVELVAVCDLNAEAAADRVGPGCPIYTDHARMLEEVEADVAVIMTPHTAHAAAAIDCLSAGLHVLVEKPLAVHIADADAMIDAADRAGRLLGVIFQQRLRPEIRAARQILDEQRLGALQRIDVTTNWPRTYRYYDQVPWRGSSMGDGGGLLLNQAPHDLDLLCYLAGGPPAQLVAWTRTILHDIASEDTLTAMAEWHDGLLGAVHVTTAQAPAGSRIEVVGTGGSLRIERGGLALGIFDIDMRTYVLDPARDPYSSPSVVEAPVKLASEPGDHAAVYRDFHAAITRGSRLAADGRDALMSLELAHAIALSSDTGSAVTLPIDRDRHVDLVERGPVRSSAARH